MKTIVQLIWALMILAGIGTLGWLIAPMLKLTRGTGAVIAILLWMGFNAWRGSQMLANLKPES